MISPRTSRPEFGCPGDEESSSYDDESLSQHRCNDTDTLTPVPGFVIAANVLLNYMSEGIADVLVFVFGPPKPIEEAAAPDRAGEASAKKA